MVMLLPATTEYALRALAVLAALPTGVGLRAEDLAGRANVPLPYLQKVLRKLVLHGLLTSRKGHHGGFVLARSAGQTRFIDVLRATDYDAHANRCAFGWPRCAEERPCPLHGPYSKLKMEFIAWAEMTTLADIDGDVMRRLLAEPES